MVTLTPRAAPRLAIIGGAFEVREYRASGFFVWCSCAGWSSFGLGQPNGDLNSLELQNIGYLCLSSEGREGRSKRKFRRLRSGRCRKC